MRVLSFCYERDTQIAIELNQPLATPPRRPAVAAQPGSLLSGCFPAPAARNSARCAIPFTRTTVAIESAVGVRAMDGDSYKTIPSYGAGNIRHARDPSVGDGEWIKRGRLATSSLCQNNQVPKSVIGRLGQRGPNQAD